jgi:hypothetical protein
MEELRKKVSCSLVLKVWDFPLVNFWLLSPFFIPFKLMKHLEYFTRLKMKIQEIGVM